MTRISSKHTLLIILAALLVALASTFYGGCASRRSIGTMSAQELLKEGIKKYEKKKHLLAQELFQTCVYNYPGESIVDTAQYYLALAYFGNKEYEVAQVEFNRLVLNYPASAYFEQAIFMRAVSSFEATPRHFGLDQAELETAIRQLEDFIIDYPESDAVGDAQSYLQTANDRLAHKTFQSASVYHRMRAYKAAKIYYQAVIDDYTDSKYASDALFKKADIEFQLGNMTEARQQFEAFGQVYPNHRWVPKASEMAEKSAFKGAENLFDSGQMSDAKTELGKFLNDFPESRFLKKAQKYLAKIGQIPPEPVESNDAGS